MECLRNKFHDGVLLDGRFQTISPLNHGSFGMVFMARDLQTSEIVAVKCLTKKSAANEAGLDFAIDDNSEELFCHRLLGAHPNIVSLIHSFETEAHVYLVLEFCPRGDLYEAIRNGYGPLETEHVRQFMLELVDAVAYMHEKGIYHRDIKPENIFLTQAGAMKLGDFGLATTDDWSYESTVGSDRYMSPEQYDSAGAGYSPAQADIWAIGICLLNILFSRNPFTTPTEADPLFLDFSRDKQSLFDVFPTMSQDTYEVIVHSMNMDPKKRSLSGVRDALERAVSFTTLEEDIDDFCGADSRAFATAHREPLRTPSIQSPQVDNGAFPWAKALHASPQPIRQLSAIPDNESYSEDLFPRSEESAGWFSGSAQTPSMSSMLTSNLAASMNSLHITGALRMPSRIAAKAAPVAGSLPITMSRPRPSVNSMSMVFGGKDTVSKSWSDMWEEDIEEEENERARQLETLKELNSRTWSHESKTDNNPTPVPDPASPITIDTQARPSGDEKPAASPVNETLTNDIDGDLVADGFFFHDVKPVTPSPARYSPPSKRTATPGAGLDKWSALGQRRRGNAATSDGERSPDLYKSKPSQQIGFGFNHSYAVGKGVWDHQFGGRQQQEKLHEKNLHTNMNNKWFHNNHHKYENTKERTGVMKSCPWATSPWRKEKRLDHFGDVEWVGGWQEAH